MCLSIPAQIIKIEKNNEAIVQTKNGVKKINISLTPNLKLQDWIIYANNTAIKKINQQEAEIINNLLKGGEKI